MMKNLFSSFPGFLESLTRTVKLDVFTGIILFLTVQSALSYKVCITEDIPTMQLACKKENDAFSEANKNDNHTEICRGLYEMWFCVARSVPQCFQNYTMFYESYLHSPHNCNPSPEQIIELQRIRKEALDRVDVVTLDTSTLQEVTESHVTDDNNHVTDAVTGDGDHTGSGKNGSKQGGHSSHTGANKGSSLNDRNMLVILLVTLVTLLQLTNQFK